MYEVQKTYKKLICKFMNAKCKWSYVGQIRTHWPWTDITVHCLPFRNTPCWTKNEKKSRRARLTSNDINKLPAITWKCTFSVIFFFVAFVGRRIFPECCPFKVKMNMLKTRSAISLSRTNPVCPNPPDWINVLLGVFSKEFGNTYPHLFLMQRRR